MFGSSWAHGALEELQKKQRQGSDNLRRLTANLLTYLQMLAWSNGNDVKSQLFTINGTIQDFRIRPGVVNLIADIQTPRFLSGIAAGLIDEPGTFTNAASLAMYDGENVEHIALLVNGVLAIGTFEWLRDIRINDEVTLVVSDTSDGPLFVHAILRKNDQLLWTPFSINHTRRGWTFHALKLGGLIFAMYLTSFGIFFLLDEKSRPSETGWLYWFFGSFAFITFIMFMSTRGVAHFGDEAEEIFHALGVPKFRRFRIKPFSICNLDWRSDPDYLKKAYIFRFSDALAAHKKRFNLP